MPSSFTRTLGSSGIEVSALGMGCWAIGGPFAFDGKPAGWSQVDDEESVRALRRAFELGVTFFDTAANYGAGHSERLLGEAFRGHRDEVVIATKFGQQVDEAARSVVFYDGSEDDSDVAGRLRTDLQASLRRLGTDYVDVYQLHVWGLSIDRALEVRDVLEQVVAEGLVRTYGWSTDRADAVRAFSTGPGCGVVQQALSVLDDPDPELLALCDELDLASINRGPLGMGLLTGKFAPTTTFAADDQRSAAVWHPGFRDGRPTEDWLGKLAAIRDVLTSGGRTLAQGALAWIWGHSQRTIPIPGFKTVEQVEENSGALAFGPMPQSELAEIDRILGREAAAA
jgi:aryl-alcohol dehydrogenase-like predicted oxidoreductase